MTAGALPVVLVAGAGGIGRAVADGLSERARVLVVDRAEPALAGIDRGWPDDGPATVGHVADLLDADQVAAVVAAAATAGPLQGLVYAAGVGPVQTDDGVEILRANLEGFAHLVEAAEAALVDGASIVGVGSVASRRAARDADGELADPTDPGWAGRWRTREPGAWEAYAYSKRGMVLYAQQAAVRLAPRRIRCNVVAPSQVASPLGRAAIADDERIAAYVASIPLQRMAEPREVGDVVAFLLSPAASFVTGVEIHVDGGAGAAGAEIRLDQEDA